MGFLDRLIGGRLIFGKREPKIVVELSLKGKKYIVDEFDMEFQQDINIHNKPDSETYGGLLTIAMSEQPDVAINDWIMSSQLQYDGDIRFFLNDGTMDSGAMLNIVFKQAHCVKYQKILNPKGIGMLTIFQISPRIIKVGNEEFENIKR